MEELKAMHEEMQKIATKEYTNNAMKEAEEINKEDYNQLSSSGYKSQLSSSGDFNHLSSSGDFNQLSSLGKSCVISAVGYFSRVSGVKGLLVSAVSYIYENGKYIPKSFCTGMIGEDGLKENTEYIGYGGKLIEYAVIDEIECGIINKRGNVLKVVLKSKLEVAYVIHDNGIFSHGKTIKEARENLLYKIGDRDTTKYNDWKLTDIKTKKELIESYRAITGACEFGTKNFCENKKLPERCSIEEAIEIIGNSWGIDTYREFFNKEV